MELPPPHVLLQLDAIIVAQRESEGNAPASPGRPPPASTPRALGPPPAPRAVVPRARPRARPPPATRSHVASMASGWVTVCTDLLEAAKGCTNLQGLREPLVSRGFRCGSVHAKGEIYSVTVPAEFPCYYDVIGKNYAKQDYANSMSTLRKYLEGALTLARTGGAYRTDAEFKQAPAPVRAAPVRPPKTSRFTGVTWDRNIRKWRAAIKVRRREWHDIPLGSFDDEEDAARAYDAALVKYRQAPTVNFRGEAPLASVLAALPTSPVAPAVAPTRRSGRAPAPKVIVDPEAPARKKARTFSEKPPYYGKCIEGARQKQSGKWYHRSFPGREFDDLDAIRAAKKQRAERRAAYSDQAAAFKSDYGRMRV